MSGFDCAERFYLIFVSYGSKNIFSRHSTAKTPAEAYLRWVVVQCKVMEAI